MITTYHNPTFFHSIIIIFLMFFFTHFSFQSCEFRCVVKASVKMNMKGIFEKMKYLKYLMFLIFVRACIAYEITDGMTVEINDGKILGRHITSHSGRTIRAFTGIPYASPPIGDLRFRAPQKVQPWNDTLIAQSRPPHCLQFNPFIRSFDVEGQEDCLYLNVFTPENPTNKKLPVIGEFSFGIFNQLTFIRLIFNQFGYMGA